MTKREPASRAKTHTRYYLADGTKVPSVTSILRVVSKGEYLLIWANNLGLDGFDVVEYRKAQAAVGTLGHALIQAELRGESFDSYGFSGEEQDRAANVLASFRAWRRTVDLEPILVEEPLVSEVARYGGTIDLYARLGKLRGVIDVKSSDEAYDEYFFQEAGYKRLAIENGYPVDFIATLNCPRSAGDGYKFTVSSTPDLDLAVFDAARGLYEVMKQREAAIKNLVPMVSKRRTNNSVELVLGGRGSAGREAPVDTLPAITEEGRAEDA